MARTDWKMSDSVMPDDMNDIGREINALVENVGDMSAVPTTAKDAAGAVTELYGDIQGMPFNMARQAIINGNFDVAQRGVGFANPVNLTYTADRWQVSYILSGWTPPNINHFRVEIPAEVPGSYFGYRISSDGPGTGMSAGSLYGIRQQIENGTRYLCGSGRKLTISFWARASSPKRLGLRLIQMYGSGGAPSGQDSIPGTNWLLDTTWQKYSITVDTVTLVGKTFGANNDDRIALDFCLAWGSDFASLFNTNTSESMINGFIQIAQVQVNDGESALPFQPRSFADELALCQRYYEKSYDIDAIPGTNTMYGRVLISKNPIDNTFYGTVPFKVTKRVDPTLHLFNQDGTTVSFVGVTANQGYIDVNTAGSTSLLSFQWTADAEL